MTTLCSRDLCCNLQRCYKKIDSVILQIHTSSHEVEPLSAEVLDHFNVNEEDAGALALLHSKKFSWNSSIQELVASGKLKQALNRFKVLQSNYVYLNRHTIQALLKACGRLQSIERGHELHAALTKTACENDFFIGSTLVDMYSKCGQLTEAQEVFNGLPNRDTVLWTSLIGAYTDHGYGAKALNCMKQMQLEGVFPNHVSFICSLKACGNLGAMDEGQGIHGEIVKRGFDKDPFVGSALVDAYSKCDFLPEAQSIVDALPCVDAVALTPLMVCWAECGSGQEAVDCWKKMHKDGNHLDAVTLMCSLKACGSIESIDWGREIHAEIVKRGLEINLSICNTLVDMYAKCGSLAEAEDVFDGLPVKDAVSWNALLYGYAEHDLGIEAHKCLELMRLAGISPTAVTCVCCLKGCGNIKMGKKIHLEINKMGFESNSFVASALVDMYATLGMFAEALKVFYELPHRNTISWTALVDGYADHNFGEEALHLLGKMVSEGVHVDAVTFACGLKVCGDRRAIARGRELHAKIAKGGMERDPLIGNMLVVMYATCSLLLDAADVSNRLNTRSKASWTSLIVGYAKSGADEDAVGYLEHLECVPMDALTLACSLKVCGSLGVLDKGRKLHTKIAREGLEGDALVVNSLMDLYAKCGLLAEAQNVFDMLPFSSTGSWTVLITGYACRGKNLHVFDLLCRMEREGIQPDKVTFLSLFTVCNHAGLVDEGQNYFINMCEGYGISPNADHVNCMIDLYSRAGQLNKVSVMVDRMPFQPNLSTWHTVLAACRKWGDVELGRHAFQGALTLDENEDAAFLLMLNIYAVSTLWDELDIIGLPSGKMAQANHIF